MPTARISSIVFTEYVFPGEGISNECTAANCGVESTFTYGCGGCAIGDNPMRFMFESFSQTQACDSTWVDDSGTRPELAETCLARLPTGTQPLQ